MRLLGLVIVATLVSHAVQLTNLRVSTAFKNAGIVPEIIPQPPKDLLTVNFASVTICLGNEVQHTSTILMPQVDYDHKPRVNYTLLFVDPDLPAAAAPAFRTTVHWIVVNIPGNKVQDGHTIAAYMPVIYYPHSGYRRYVFLLYAQKERINVFDRDLIQLGVNRFQVSLSDFVRDYNLTELVAGNYFVSSFELYSSACKRDSN